MIVIIISRSELLMTIAAKRARRLSQSYACEVALTIELIRALMSDQLVGNYLYRVFFKISNFSPGHMSKIL